MFGIMNTQENTRWKKYLKIKEMQYRRKIKFIIDCNNTVTVAFHDDFCLKIYQNNILLLLFLKNKYFLYNYIKTIQKINN
jgi:hypothetical protein